MHSELLVIDLTVTIPFRTGTGREGERGTLLQTQQRMRFTCRICSTALIALRLKTL
ncbi:hypothetical protein [Phytobacter sp. V91]|uniref:hypothetical protein n=1 Tax=Phytobacter sp. V91 TaxID=3369425 RepID=UPI003F5E1CFB